MLILGFFLLNGAFLVGSQPEVGAGTPENITVQLLDSKTVEIFWTTSWKNVERYDVTYNPTENRVVSQAAGNSHSIVLRELRPNTQYQVVVTAVVGGKNYRSRRLVFRTSHDPNETLNLHEFQSVPTKPTKLKKSHPVTPEIVNPDPTAIGSKYTPPTSTTVRGVEIGLVLLALVVWIIAIALFFHRWGKIRMLLPYQPDYKTQQSLKVPGTGTSIVSGCTGTTATQGQADGAGCVQHLRWPSRYLDETSTAKKTSPTKRAHKLQVSSTLFPVSSSFFYMRTSTECESPRVIRHAYSHSELSTEAIPLCQVSQPRKGNHENIISITVPVVANGVNEKAQTTKTPDEKCRELNKTETDTIINLEDSEFCDKDSKKAIGIIGNNSDFGSVYMKTKNERGEKPLETESLFFVESNRLSFRETTEDKKPMRYSRLSLKKQKVRLYDDRDFENVPISETEKTPKPPESDHEKTKKPIDIKSAEMRRKAFLRKVSLQDTYVNYNQDYWLDYKKSARFHKSIDLGDFGKEDTDCGKSDNSEALPRIESNRWLNSNCYATKKTIQMNPTETVPKRSYLPLMFGLSWGVKKSGSDSMIFSSKKSPCKACGSVNMETNSNELLSVVVNKCKKQNFQKKKSWFFLPSNENIPLFSDRNGLIETDFDILDEENSLTERPQESYEHLALFPNVPEQKEGTCTISMDFSSFCEIKLSAEEGEATKMEQKLS